MQCNHIGIMASKVQPTKAHPQSLSSLPTLALGGTSASDLQPMEKLLHSFMATLPQPSTPVPHHLHWLQVTASLFRRHHSSLQTYSTFRKTSNFTERLPFHVSLSCIGEGNGNPLQCSCLENPRDAGAWWAAIYGVTQSRT